MSTERLRTALADRYRIERELGQGGMATVYLAHDLRHQRDVAIKVLHPDLGAALGSDRFLTEIRTTARLQHPHILPLLDSGEADGLLYYVMPLVTGETLRSRLERERQLPVDDAVRIAREVADALGHAHELGVIHRDIKPENILLQGGHALVADFGIALAVQQAGGARMTQTGLSLGTPQYMSPEQAMGEKQIDARSDIYALGAVTYEMLAGDPPFTGSSVQAIVAKVMTERPSPIRTVRDTVPDHVERAVFIALAKLPADRFTDAAEYARALADAEPTATRRLDHRAPSRSRWTWLLGLSGGLVGFAAGYLLFGGGSAVPLMTGAIRHVTIDDGLEVQPAISPDGKMVVYAAGTSLGVRLYLRPVDGGRAVPLTRDSTDQQDPQWSPGGNSLLYLSNGGVDTVAAGLGGSAATTLIAGEMVRQGTMSPRRILAATWSSDGRRVVFARRDSLLEYTIATGTTRTLATGRAFKSCTSSPSGEFIACTDPRNFTTVALNMGNAGPSTVVVIPAAGGTPIAVTDSTSLNISPVWSPDSRRLYFVSNRDGQRDIYFLAMTSSGKPSGPAKRLTTALNAASLSLSRDGRRLAFSVYTPQANIWSVPILPNGVASSTMATQVTFGHQLIESIEMSPNGRALIFDADHHGNFDIFIQRLGERDAEALTNDPADEFGGQLSPDGRKLVFYSYREGTGNGLVMVKPMSGGGPIQQVNSSASYGIWPEWMPDGTAITWECGVRGHPAWCLATQDGAGAWRVARRDGGAPSNWSPDGRWLTNHRRNGSVAFGDSLWIRAGDSSEARLLYARRAASDPQVSVPRWSPDSRSIYFRSRDAQGRAQFWSVSIDGGKPRLVAELDDPTRQSYRPDFATDGTRLYFAINDRQSDISVVELIDR